MEKGLVDNIEDTVEKEREEEQEDGKFYCESCGDEITEEEYKRHNKLCKKCFL
ncbi:MAG: hypothetical protein P9M06_06205 [Candidatus Saelkia tenebricola]|nr:hypothetical protein [Candidatus Saelkia tenebricola]